MTDSMLEKIHANVDRVFFPYLGKDNIFTNGIKIDRALFKIGDLVIYWYGFLIALGALIAMLYCFRKLTKFGINPDKAVDSVIGGFIGAIIGARLYYVIFSIDNYIVNGKIVWKDIINIRDGGLAIYGGIIGALLVGGIISKINKIRVSAMFDVASLGFLIGQAVGRWGNFFNQEAFGSVTKLPWGMTSELIMDEVAPKFPSTPMNELVVHPCFLYESLWCIIGFILLNFYLKRRKFDGEIFLMYIGWYGLGRAIIEGFRTDSLMIGEYIRVSQMLAIVCVVVAVAAIAIMRIKIKETGYQFYYETEISKKMLEEYRNPPKKEKKEKVKVDKDLTKVIEHAFDDDKKDNEEEANMKVIVEAVDDDNDDNDDDDDDDDIDDFDDDGDDIDG